MYILQVGLHGRDGRKFYILAKNWQKVGHFEKVKFL